MVSKMLKHDIFVGYRLQSSQTGMIRIGDVRGEWSRYNTLYFDFCIGRLWMILKLIKTFSCVI